MTTLGDGGLPWKMEELNGTPLRVAPAAEELARLGVTRVDIVKIDVEGHEIEALRGLGPSLRRLGVQQHGQSAPLGSAPGAPRAPGPPQGAPGGSGQLGALSKRPAHWAPSHCLGGSSEPPPKSPISLPFVYHLGGRATSSSVASRRALTLSLALTLR